MHTPGEWYAKPTAGDHQQVIASDTTGATVALVYDPANGDADLIAAAPDLLAALRNLEFYGRHWGKPVTGFVDAMSAANAAIAKAEGR